MVRFGSDASWGQEGRAAERGFTVLNVTSDEAATRFGVLAAPMFAVVDPAGEVRYVGGYTGRKQGLDIRDQHTLASLRAGGEPVPIPIYGCGASTSLQVSLDPFRIAP